jgi:tetratricopeptide (TPR) repeat protein
MRQVDPGDLRRLPPTRTLSIGPPATYGVLDGPPVEVALPTWLLLCDLQLLGGPGPEKPPEAVVRGSAFEHGSSDGHDLAAPLTILDQAVCEPRAVRQDGRVETALRSLVEGFRDRGWKDAARAVSETWLWVQPESFAANLHAGVLIGEAGRAAEAEALIARAVIVARQAGDWAAYCTAGVALGDAHRARGDLASAERIYTKVLSRARRHGIRSALQPVAGGLLAVAVEGGDIETAERRAAEALDLHPAGDARVREIAADLASLWTQAGRFDDALGIFTRLGDMGGPAARQARYAASACRAAAGVGDREWFERYWAVAWQWTYDESAREAWSVCLAELETAATAIGEAGRAELVRRRMGTAAPGGAAGTSARAEPGATPILAESSTSLVERVLAHIR